MPDEQISDKVVDQLAIELDAYSTDLTGSERWNIVRPGKLQESGLKNPTSILLHIGHPTDDTWIDGSTALERSGISLNRQWVNFPAFETGGGVTGLWWRRFTVAIECNFVSLKKNRDESRRLANLVKGRVEYLLGHTAGVVGLIDSFSESAVLIMPVSSFMKEQGGPDNQFIWRGEVRFQVLTNRG